METTRAQRRCLTRLGSLVVLAALLGGCGATTGTYETSWLRSFSHKAWTFDSGGEVTTWVQIRKSWGWAALPGASTAVALRDGKRAVVRNEDDSLMIVDDQGRIEPLPACKGRDARVSPAREWVMCFERGLHITRFTGDALLIYSDETQPGHSTLCRLTLMYRDGRVTTRTQTAPDRGGCYGELQDPPGTVELPAGTQQIQGWPI